MGCWSSAGSNPGSDFGSDSSLLYLKRLEMIGILSRVGVILGAISGATPGAKWFITSLSTKQWKWPWEQSLELSWERFRKRLQEQSDLSPPYVRGDFESDPGSDFWSDFWSDFGSEAICGSDLFRPGANRSPSSSNGEWKIATSQFS